MTWKVPVQATIAYYGTSLTTGRLSTFWVEDFTKELMACPEAIGPIVVYNMGKGSQNSNWGLANANFIANLRPKIIISEGFGINSAIEIGGTPQVTLSQHIVNMQGMHDMWKAADPNVDIIWQSMNDVGAEGAYLRPYLRSFYEAEKAKAALMGDRFLDNFSRWPHPMPPVLTQDGDLLHPTEIGTDMFLKPYVLLETRKALARLYGLEEPVA